MDSSDKLEIWVLRHAKAAGHGPSGDVSRPLTGRGRRQAASVCEHLQALGEGSPADLENSPGNPELLPSLVLCSPAVRARETAELVMPAMPQARLQFEKGLYDEDAAGVLEWLRLIDPVESRVMIVGHNPTLQELCLMLAEPVYLDELESAGLPTAGLVRLVEPVPAGANGTGTNGWRGLTTGVARVAHRFVPKS